MTHPPQSLIQELRLADAAQILSMMAEGAPGHRVWSTDAINDEISQSQSLVARQADGGVRAFIFLRDAVDALEISYLATSARARNTGVMRGLLGRAIGLAQESGRPIWLEVHEQNGPARKLYESTGFVRTGLRPNYYADGAAAILYTYG